MQHSDYLCSANLRFMLKCDNIVPEEERRYFVQIYIYFCNIYGQFTNDTVNDTLYSMYVGA